MTERTAPPRRAEAPFPPFYRRIRLWHVLVAVAAVALAVPLAQLLETPARADLAVENPTEYDVRIEVSGGEDDGSLTIGTARRRATSRFEGVIDQGDIWVFRFTAQGHEAGELRVDRDDLESDGWRVVIPERLGEELAARGVTPPP
jgi:hypothetical protein